MVLLKNQLVKVEIIIRQLIVILMVIAVFFISACNEKDNIDHFSSKEETMEHFVQNENIKGNIDLITTTNDESLLVVQSSGNTYFVGELVEDKEGYYAKRISDNVEMTIGASWELNTMDKNEYTIFFEKNKEDANYIQFSNGEYDISLVEGHTIRENTFALTSAIKEVEIVKD
ncbi:hypothetical protein [Psychrobacillus faecigallinarum]|uniref:hypothetical protein n=1 Tax=Psychrobacillus faecigallinarum TaxID=2762235 RepID=UPI001781FF2B|nr:hypothetical protein [Psychrobacillus faecigallinarum]